MHLPAVLVALFFAAAFVGTADVDLGKRATSTSAASACSTGQIVVNPSFYGLPPVYAPDIAPWTIHHDIGNADPACFYDDDSYNDAARDEYYGDPRS
ncbi:MAG: hypothetical protein Q9191_006080, partial [Dirinaria sp. TL-2023a]